MAQAYKNYISFILERTNTITGVQYKNDPIIFALELANEPHTSDNYEINLGLQPGSIVLAWVYQISAYIKSISPNHMVRRAAAPWAVAHDDGVHNGHSEWPARAVHGWHTCPGACSSGMHAESGSDKPACKAWYEERDEVSYLFQLPAVVWHNIFRPALSACKAIHEKLCNTSDVCLRRADRHRRGGLPRVRHPARVVQRRLEGHRL